MNARLSERFRFVRVARRAASQCKALRAGLLAQRVLAGLLILGLVLPGGLFSPSPAAAQALGSIGGFLEISQAFFGEGGIAQRKLKEGGWVDTVLKELFQFCHAKLEPLLSLSVEEVLSRCLKQDHSF